ncbi:F0F1 ATP synthase subunit B [Lacibacterium aquatile]|uniref:ATP synthase subunit b n=1 Tax=Lacibacterium aquatile TaxID=1168082 RepID=A0ABW5DWW7_9PROT
MLHDTNFWVLLGFALFVAVAGKKIWNALTALLDNHTATVRAQLAEATALRTEAEALLAKAKSESATAQADSTRIVEQAKHAAAEISKAAAADLEGTLARRQKGALDKIAQAEAAALAEVRSVAVDVAIAATSKLLVEKTSGALAGQMIDQAIADLPGRLN